MQEQRCQQPHINSERLLSDLRELATIGKYQTGVDRVAFSAADMAARRWLVTKLQAAGLDAAMDRVGNVLGRCPNVEAAVLIGSHTDTVPRGGWLDGALGVIYGLEIARSALEGGEHLADRRRRGVVRRRGRYVPAVPRQPLVLRRCGRGRHRAVPIAQRACRCRRRCAAVAQGAPLLRLDRARQLCFLEAHIEQGPRLEAIGRRIGVVTAIVGIRRFRVACARPRRPCRHDADGAAQRCGCRTDQARRLDRRRVRPSRRPRHGLEHRRHGVPARAPPMSCRPRPKCCSNSAMPATATLDALEARMLRARRGAAAALASCCEARATHASRRPRWRASLAETIAAAAAAAGEQVLSMPSGAGHDAMVLGRFIPTAMMFVPSIGGRSHDVSENTVRRRHRARMRGAGGGGR